MKLIRVRILRRQKIEGEVGTIAEVTPERADFLIAGEAAVKVPDAGEQADRPEAAETRKAPEKKPAAKTAKSAKKK